MADMTLSPSQVCSDCSEHGPEARENWRAVPGWEGVYEVSDHGNVRSLDRVASDGKRIRGRRLIPGIDSGGYPIVNLWCSNVGTSRRVHALVMAAFDVSTEVGLQIAHNDGNPLNARVGNLRHATPAENAADKVRHGTQPRGSAVPGHVLTEADVLEIAAALDAGYKQSSIADYFGIRGRLVSKIHQGSAWGWLTGRTSVPADHRGMLKPDYSGLPICARYGCGTELPRDTDDELCADCRWNSYADAAEDARADRYDRDGNR